MPPTINLAQPDPACDLAVCLAIASASLGRALHGDVLAIGEVALSFTIDGQIELG